jgi:hypothetical protein
MFDHDDQMTETFSQQYQTKAVKLLTNTPDAQAAIRFSHEIGARYRTVDGDHIVVEFPGRPIELYTDRAFRSSCQPTRVITSK